MTKKATVCSFLAALLIAYALTGLLVLLSAWITYKMNLSDKAVGFMVVFIYIIVNVIAGLYIGKKLKKKQFLWGMLSGALYALILFLISVVLTGGVANIAASGLCTMLLSAGGGTLGGMIS